jgi:hypothetical protein
MSDFSGAGIILLGLYFLPSIIAIARKVKNSGSVIIVNFFLGWTLIGWIVALAMASRTDKKQGQENPIPPTQQTVQPPSSLPTPLPPVVGQQSSPHAPLPTSKTFMSLAREAGKEWGNFKRWISTIGSKQSKSPGSRRSASKLWWLLVIPGLVAFYVVMPKEESSSTDSVSTTFVEVAIAPTTTEPPVSWKELLQADQDANALTVGKCSELESLLSKQAKLITSRLDASQSPAQDAFESADYLKTNDWSTLDHTEELLTAQLALTNPVVTPALSQSADEQQLVGFLEDSLTACVLSDKASDVMGDARSLDSRLASMKSKANNLPWYPKGFSEFEDGIAWRWAERGEYRCSYGDHCWGMFIVAKFGCPSMLYAEITILDSGGTNIGFTNDTTSSVGSGQQAKLVFEDFTPGADSARLAEIKCY